VAAIIAAIGLFFTGYQSIRTHRQAQVGILEGVYNDIRELERELAEIPDPTSELDPEYQTRMQNWSSRFFNALEWLSLLINTKEIEKKELVGHFEPAILDWYDSIFQAWASEKQKTNDKDYPELKKLVRRIRGSA
jgi:hypothetical protein